MPIARAGTVGVILNGANAGERLNPDYAWYDAAEPDLSPTAITGPPPIAPVGGPGDGPNLLEWQESGFPFGSEQSQISYTGTLPPGVRLVHKEVRPESPPGSNPWPVGVLAEWAWAGVPTTPGVYNVTVNPSSHAGSAGYPGADFTWTISLAGGCPLITIEPATIDLEFIGQPIALTLTAEDGVAPYTWDVAFGEFPDGLALSSGGELTGAPTTAGDYEFTIRATDDNGCQGARVYTLSIVVPDPIIVFPLDPILPVGARDVRYEQIFTAEGGVGEPYVFTIADYESDLPDGLELGEDGTLAGVPSVAGLFVFTVRATDAALNFGEREYTLQITGLRITISDGGSGGPMIDVTREVEHADIELPLNRQATARVVFGDGYIPARGADVLMYARDGITPIFGGLVLTRHVQGMSASHPADRCDTDFVDYSLYFDDAEITLTYTTPQALEDVVAAVVFNSIGAYGITYDPPVLTGITVAPFDWQAIKVSEAFKRLSDETGVVFRVLPLKELDVFVPLSRPAPGGEDEGLDMNDLSWHDTLGIVPNTVDLLCGQPGNWTVTQEWVVGSGETEWEVDIQAVVGEAAEAHAAHGFLGTTGNFAAGETVTLGSSVYTFRASLVGDVAGEVLIGATEDDSLNNLIAAILNAGGSGYAPSTPVNADATAYLRQPSQLAANAITPGTAGNAIAVATTGANALWYGEGAIPIAALQQGTDASAAGGWTQGFVLEVVAANAANARPLGAPGSGAYYEWDVTLGRGTVTLGSGSAAPVGTFISLLYLAVYPFHARVSSGSPPVTFREAHPEILVYQHGINLATAILARESAGHREVEVLTNVDGFLPGQELDLDVAAREILGFFLVSTVRIVLVNQHIWDYRVTCQESTQYQGSFVEQWKALTSGASSASTTAPATPPDGGAAVAGDIYSDGRTAFRGDQSMGGQKLTNLGVPTAPADAVTKAYVDAATPTGDIKADGSVDFTADQSMGGFALTDVDDPTVAQDAATKAYVDASVADLGIEADTVAAAETQASGAAYADLATVGPSVTKNMVGTTAIVWISGYASRAGTGNSAFAAVAVSGASTVAAADANAARGPAAVNTGDVCLARMVKLTGLTPGPNTFKLQYRNDGGSTWTFHDRGIAVYAP